MVSTGTSVDIVKSGGFKISTLEIEAVLLQHPAIAECVVMGTPDKDYGEIVVAIIVPCKEQIAGSAAVHEPVLTLKALQRWAHNLLAPYKIPQQLQVWESLPRNVMGKVQSHVSFLCTL
jgi:malonyl-CoA/methylmalonyl-CoA synthetase